MISQVLRRQVPRLARASRQAARVVDLGEFHLVNNIFTTDFILHTHRAVRRAAAGIFVRSAAAFSYSNNVGLYTTRPHSIRSYSTDSTVFDAAAALQVDDLILQGQILAAEERLRTVLEQSPDNMRALQLAMAISDFVGSWAEQTQFLARLRQLLENQYSEQFPFDFDVLDNLVFQLKSRALHLAALGIHSAAIERLEVAKLAAKFIPETKFMEDIEKHLKEQRRLPTENGPEDRIRPSSPADGFGHWPAFQSFELILNYNADYMQHLRSSALFSSIGQALEATRQGVIGLDGMQQLRQTIPARLQLSAEQTAINYLTQSVASFVSRLITRDDLAEAETVLNGFAHVVDPDEPKYQLIQKRLNDAKQRKSELSPTALRTQRPLHRALWLQAEQLVAKLKQQTDDKARADVSRELKQLFISIATIRDPAVALDVKMWVLYASLRHRPIQEAVVEARRFLHRLNSGEEVQLPPGYSRNQITYIVRRELEYMQLRETVQRAVDAGTALLIPDFLNAISAANRAIALAGAPSLLDGFMLKQRALIYSAMNLNAEALRDIGLAQLVYPSHPDFHRTVGFLLRAIDGPNTKPWTAHMINSHVAQIREWTRAELSYGVFGTQMRPSMQSLDRLVDDTAQLDQLVRFELNLPRPSQAQLWNAAAYYTAYYKPAQARTTTEITSAISALGEHFKQFPPRVASDVDIAKAKLLFNMALIQASHPTQHMDAVKTLDEAISLYARHNVDAPEFYSRLKEDVSAGPLESFRYMWRSI